MRQGERRDEVRVENKKKRRVRRRREEETDGRPENEVGKKGKKEKLSLH